MAIKQSRAIYVGGYDKEYFIDEMSNSHIINSIRQIRDNIRAVKAAEETHGNYGSGVQAAVGCLLADEEALLKELASRDNCDECC